MAVLEAAVSSKPNITPLLATALRNQANLYGYVHNHPEALNAYERARTIIHQYSNQVQDTEIEQQLAYEDACIAVSSAVDLMALARLQDAEQALHTAIAYFEQAGNKHHESHARSNLASLYARTGQYSQALSAFEQALQTLWDSEIQLDELPLEELQAADVLLLDQALVFLALNLQSAALHTLTLAEQLFTHAQRPYELAQTLYARGLLHIQAQDWTTAATPLEQAESIFADLHNQYWTNRTTLARVTLLQQQGNYEAALELLLPLQSGEPTAFDKQWYGWDLGGATELYLHQLQLALHANDLGAARAAANVVEQIFQQHFGDLPPTTTDSDSVATLFTADETVAVFGVPHLRFAYLYALGRIERAANNFPVARSYFQQAVTILEAQRATLPLEEIRIAFLGDKAAVYTDWLLTLLDVPDVDTKEVIEAFAIVERARSRALLERLLAALDESTTNWGAAEADEEEVDQSATQPPVAYENEVINHHERARHSSPLAL